MSIVALRVVESDEKGAWCLGVQLGHPVTGGHKYRDLFLQVWGLMQGCRPCSIKNITVSTPQEVNTRHKLAESSKVS
jgi:hypothetical protein